MGYYWDRISYTTETHCHAGCNRPLLSGIAHILIDDQRNEYHCGKDCAEKLAGPKPKNVPNVTLSTQNDSNSQQTKSEKGNSSEIDFKTKKKLATEYLILRARYNHSKAIHWSKFSDWYERRNQLSQEDINHIFNLRRVNIYSNMLSPIFLTKVWVIQNSISKYIIKHPKEKVFLNSLIDFVGTNLSLSLKQKEVLINKLNNVDISFLPDFQKRKKSTKG